jgi:hypothetical protein
MKKLVRIHNWMVEGCANACDSLMGYNKILDDFNDAKPITQERPRVTVDKPL